GLLLDKLFPGKFVYTRDGKFFVGLSCPDFVNHENKLIIEVFGGWHRKKEDAESRVKFLQEHGYKTIIIWEEELRRPLKLVDKLMAVPLLTISEVEEVRQEALGLEQKNSERLHQLEEFVSRLVAEKGEQVLALDQSHR